MEPLDGRKLTSRSRRASAKHVRIFQIPEKPDGVVHTIDAKIEIRDVYRRKLDRGLIAGRESLAAAQREIRFLLFLSADHGGKQKQRNDPDDPEDPTNPHCPSPPLKMFQRKTPRKLLLPGMGRHCG